MSVNVERTELPGIGIRHDLMTHEGRRLSVIDYREGGREIAVCSAGDPDRASTTLELNDDEATALSELLGGTLVLAQVAGLKDQVAGLHTEQLPVRADSPYVGRPLGDTQARTLTRCSIVGIVRDTGVLPAPGPEDKINAGDSLIVVGTREGLDQLAHIINGG